MAGLDRPSQSLYTCTGDSVIGADAEEIVHFIFHAGLPWQLARAPTKLHCLRVRIKGLNQCDY